MDGLKAKMGLMYAQLSARVREVYDEWEVSYTEADIERVVTKAAHMHVVVRDEYNRRKDAEKRTALVFELHRISGKSEGMIRKMLKK